MTVTAPPGYRDGGRPIFNTGEVVSSTYQMRSLLATSDTGQVYEAWDMLLERLVAIKAAWRDEGVRSIVNEARAPGAIRDPCAAEVHGLGHHHGNQFLVAERIAGTALGQRIEAVYGANEQIPLLDCIEILAMLARGMAAVHRAGYGTPHVSARNIVLTDQNRLVLCQFALGQGQVEATPPILAPEVIMGAVQPQAGQRSGVAVDLYALGCIATELLTGKPPFAGDTLKAVTFAHVKQRAPQLGSLREDVPTELGDLVQELLAKQPEHRPESAADVHAQLRTIVERASASRPPLRVLIVDDDPGRVRTLWSVVRRAHACTMVEAARDAEHAIAVFRRERPNVFILNMQLPGGMNGFELLMYLSGAPEAQSCVMVALTGSGKENDARVLAQLGVPHVLPQGPGSHAEIIALIRRLVASPSARSGVWRTIGF